MWFTPKMSSEVARILVPQKYVQRFEYQIFYFEYLKDIGQIPQPMDSEYEMGSKLDKGVIFYLLPKLLEIPYTPLSCIR